MAFQLSPGVLVVEKDLTNIIPAVATSIGAFVGNFSWGPVMQPFTVSSELDLVKTFGKPNLDTYLSFFSAANFLSYSNNLVLIRQVGAAARNAVASGTAIVIKNEETWLTQYADGSGNVGPFAAKYPGVLGNSLKVSMADRNAFSRVVTGTLSVTEGEVTVTGTGSTFTTDCVVGDYLVFNGTEVGQIQTISSNTQIVLTAGASIDLTAAEDVVALWEYANEFDEAPGTSFYAETVNGVDDELHVIVVDEDGVITGTPGASLEKFANLSKARDGKGAQGGSSYYVDALLGSRFIYWMDHATAVSSGGSAFGSSALGTTFKTLNLPVTVSLTGGVSETSLTSGEVRLAYDLFKNAENIDISLVIIGHHGLSTAKYVIQNIAETRMDCVVFCSPSFGAVVNNPEEEAADSITERRDVAFNVSSSYAVMDSGWKYQYDKYNDTNRWIPLNADIAGLCARTDTTNDPWWSPGGFNRGQIKNVVRLAYNPNKAERDNLYKSGINPVVSSPGEGVVLLGDKTLLAKPSAFDRINVRRLFIVLEKAIAIAAKYQLFEFNDSFTRAQFKNLVEPFLRDVKGRRGIYNFHVVCDESNNTGEVIDRNEFIADIYLKPARSINYITLNFVAVRTGVAFEEVVGKA